MNTFDTLSVKKQLEIRFAVLLLLRKYFPVEDDNALNFVLFRLLSL